MTIDKDSAVATGHSRVYLHTDAGWKIERVSADRWELERGPDGWVVRRRLNQQPPAATPVANCLLQDCASESGAPQTIL
ncbi:hypothetical protein [Aeromicrobium sp. UC242_57]|uniref:hypothetical protein n=1 Tax=Aeromicrobium sp. UC242_57 TaxID=3374624 RepID=UPI0037AD4BE3